MTAIGKTTEELIVTEETSEGLCSDTEKKAKKASKKRKDYDLGRLPTPEEQERVKRWASWSMQPHTPDEIRAEILRDNRCVCITYVCEHSKIPSSFMDEFLVLSTFLLDDTNYETNYDDVKNLLFAKLKIGDYDKNLTEIIIENRQGVQIITIDDIADRIDWKAIGIFQRIDLYTAERYGKFLPWDQMTPRCGLSQIYIDANKYEYITKYSKIKKETEIREENIFAPDYDDDDFDDDVDFNIESDIEAGINKFID